VQELECMGDFRDPAVTIITVVRNHPSGLISTIQSALRQGYNNWSIIILVGDSQDNTLDVAQRFSNENKNVLVIEQDGIGIYQAMNQATKLVTSKYVWYMNAGDEFYDEFSIATAVSEAEEGLFDLLIGGHKIDHGENHVCYSFSGKTLNPFWFSMNRRFGCHQAMLFRTSKVKALGYYNTSYKLVADFDLVMRLCSTGAVRRSPSLLAVVEPGGVADQNIVFVHREKQLVRKTLLSSRTLIFIGQIWTILAILKVKMKTLESLMRREVDL